MRSKSHSPPHSAQPSIRRAPSMSDPVAPRPRSRARRRRTDTARGGGRGRARSWIAAEELDVGAQDRPGEIVLARPAGRRSSRRAAAVRAVDGRSCLARSGVLRQSLRPVLGGVAEDRRTRGRAKRSASRIEVPRERLLVVRRLEVRRRRGPGPGRGRRRIAAAPLRQMPRCASAFGARGPALEFRDESSERLAAAGLFTRHFAVPARMVQARPGPRDGAPRHRAERPGLGRRAEVDVKHDRHGEAG